MSEQVWISTEDRLPPAGISLWICIDDGQEVVHSEGIYVPNELDQFTKTPVFWMSGGPSIPVARVTHWMPMLTPMSPKAMSERDNRIAELEQQLEQLRQEVADETFCDGEPGLDANGNVVIDRESWNNIVDLLYATGANDDVA